MMNGFKKFASWIKGPKSDFFLFVVALLLLNAVSFRAFFRVDLTAQRAYSLSRASRETIRSLEEPLSVKVFFTKNLPSPYNGVETYLRDLLVEYGGAGNKISYSFFDMEKPDAQELARSYGVEQVQVQEVKDNEVGVKNAYMGLVVSYADAIETVNGLTQSDGLEYRLTTTISNMIGKVNSLSGLKGKITLTVYASAELSAFGIQGYDSLEQTVRASYDRVNKKSMGKIDFAFVRPSQAEVPALVAKYGLQELNWEADAKGTPAGVGALGIVLEYGNRSHVLPIALARGLFGGYGLAGLDTLEDDISQSLQSLVQKSPTIGYLTGHGEKSLDDEQNGAARLRTLTANSYEFKNVDLAKGDVPAGISCLMINGPTVAIPEGELYKIDQFLMRGGNLLVFADPFQEIRPQGDMAYFGGQPQYLPIQNGLDRLLSKYGVTLPKAYALDKACYTAQQQGTGKVSLYYVPLLAKESLNAKESVSKNLAYVLMLMAGPIEISEDAAKAEGRKIVPLATTSDEAWRMSDNISLMPYAMTEPDKASMKKENLSVLLEGKFDSAFGGPVAGSTTAETASADTASGDAAFSEKMHVARSTQNARIIVTGTSMITTQSVIDETGSQPVAILVRNMIDYANGNDDLIAMRTKGLSLNTLDKTGPAVRTTARVVNQYGLPALVAVAGLVAWRIRVKRRRSIETRYAKREAN